jgi:cyclopropane fatty-acyl-phospholipid synthase-like methyltransferase
MTDRPDIALELRERRDARLSSPSAGRNKAVIAAALAELLAENARVLEIASGTGEHALACVTARPDLSWTPSEPDDESRGSVDAWAEEAGGRIARCLSVATTEAGWADGIGPFDALFCANMIHIAPWEAAEGLFRGAAELIAEGGMVCLYGPFQEGATTAPSNLDFDASLKARDPRWGVRALSDVDALAQGCGFDREARREMPANNLLLVYRKAAS